MSINLAAYVHQRAVANPDAIAIYVNKKAYSYRELTVSAFAIAQWMQQHSIERLGILGDKSFSAYSAVIAAAWIGKAYVPLNPKLPASRLIYQMKKAECNGLFIAEDGANTFKASDLLNFCQTSKEQLKLGHVDSNIDALFQTLDVVSQQISILGTELPDAPPNIQGKEEAYILFTSGSTGFPKGVVISTRARQTLIEAYKEKYDFSASDKVAQPCSLCWDVSVGNMVIAFSHGAALYLLNDFDLLSPTRFIRKHDITVWHSVPTIAAMLKERGALKQNIFPSLRWSDFSGEALTYDIARTWKAAAPHSAIVNSYGPTEATVDCLDFEIENFKQNGNVPIGYPFPQCHMMVCDDHLQPLEHNQKGELLVSGPQLATAYVNDPEKTEHAFPLINGHRWYRTGDTVSKDKNGCFYFHGRVDNQIKLLGHRIELEGLEQTIKKALGTEVIVCACPANTSHKDFLIAFVVGNETDIPSFKKQLSENLPHYALPRVLQTIKEVKLTHNGKIDRKYYEHITQNELS